MTGILTILGMTSSLLRPWWEQTGSLAAFLWCGMCPDHASTPDLGKRRTGVDEALDGDADDPADSSESDASDADAHGDAATGSLDAQPHSRPSLP